MTICTRCRERLSKNKAPSPLFFANRTWLIHIDSAIAIRTFSCLSADHTVAIAWFYMSR